MSTVNSLKGQRSHKPPAAPWLGRGDLPGTLYAYSQAASAATNLYGVPRRIHCSERDNSPARELSCRAWEMAGLPFLAARLKSCLHKAVAAEAPLLLCRSAPIPALLPALLHVSPHASRRCPSILSKSYHLSSSLPPGPSSSPRAALFSSPSLPAEEGVRGIKGQELSETQTEQLLRNPGSAAINAGENVLCSKAICIAACCNTFVCIVPLLFSGV